MRENICKIHSNKELVSKIHKNSKKSTIRESTTSFKMGKIPEQTPPQRDILYKWQISMKDTHHHMSLGNGKLKQQ